MSRLMKRWGVFAVLASAVLLLAGCDLSSLSYILAGAPEPTQPSEMMELVPEGKNKEAKVLVLTHSGMEFGPEFVTVERELSGLFTRQLRDICAANKQKISIILPNKVQVYKNEHPDWNSLALNDIGKHFGADYVIYLDIESMSLYERGSSNQLYRGRAEILIRLVNMHKLEDDPLEKHYSCEYPEIRGPIPVDDSNPHQFYMGFMNYVAKHLAWQFAPHPLKESFCE